jgi:hypothetical protein
MTNTTYGESTSVHFANGRQAGLGESLGFRRWLAVIDGAREVGGLSADHREDSEAFKSAIGEAREGYVSTGLSKDSFDKSATYLRKIRVAFPNETVDQMVKTHGNLNRAYKNAQAALAPKDSDGNPVVTRKSAAEYEAGARAAIRLALGAGVSQATIDAITADEAAKLTK